MNPHPLKSKLHFWLTQVRYSGNEGTFVQIALGDVLTTVEDFYSMFEVLHEKTPFEDIKEGGYSLFKESVKPSEESIRDLVRYFCDFQCDKEKYLYLFLPIVSGKFDYIYGIYTQKHKDKPWRIEIWTKGQRDVQEQQIISDIKDFFGDKIPDLKIRRRKQKS